MYRGRPGSFRRGQGHRKAMTGKFPQEGAEVLVCDVEREARKKYWRSFGTMPARVVNVTVREEVEDLIGQSGLRADPSWVRTTSLNGA